MSKPRNEWYFAVKGFIMLYYNSEQSTEIRTRICNSIDLVLNDTKKKDLANERLQAIDMILLKKTHTIDGVSLHLHYSRRTVQDWISEFIREVGERSGF